MNMRDGYIAHTQHLQKSQEIANYSNKSMGSTRDNYQERGFQKS